MQSSILNAVLGELTIESGLSSEWGHFDDSSAKSIGDGKGENGVVTPAAYVLFYRRRTFN